MQRAWVAVALVSIGCHAPPVEILTDDAGVDASDGARDSVAAADALILPDGARCEGHDEDKDGVPDLCDHCPGIPDDSLGDPGSVGAACIAPIGSPFAAATTRLFFDPFTSHAETWRSYAGSDLFTIDDLSGDVMIGGTAADQDVRFEVARQGAGARAVVATTVVGSAGSLDGESMSGILLRAAGTPKQFFFCFQGSYTTARPVPVHGPIQFGIARTPPSGCSGGPCELQVLSLRTAPASISAIDVGIGLRASITSGAATARGTIECRVWDVHDPATLQTTDPSFAQSLTLDETQFLPSGDVGFAARSDRAAFGWFEVLTEPQGR